MSEAIWSICLELQPFAAAVIGPDSVIEASNERADDLLSRRSDLVGVAHGRLSIGDADAQRKLAEALKASQVPSRFALRLSDPAGGLLHWLIFMALPAYPVSASTATPSPRDRRFFVSFRMSNEISALFDPDRLMVDLGLTRSEARVAAALAEGLSPIDYAERDGKGIATARWHLENARRKLGCASQAELVRTVLLVSV